MEVDQIRAQQRASITQSRPCKHCGGSHWDDDCFKAKGGKAGGKAPGKTGGKPLEVRQQVQRVELQQGKSTASSASYTKEDRECYHCGKKGHLKKDCWFAETGGKAAGKTKGKPGKDKVRQVEDGSSQLGAASLVSASSVPSVSPDSSISQVLARNAQGHMRVLADEEDDQWCLALASDDAYEERSAESVWILVDSGSDEHCCPETWCEDKGHNDTSDPKYLRDAQGGTVATKGARSVCLNLDGSSIRTGRPRKIKAEAKFQVSNVREPILSMGKLGDCDETTFGAHGPR